jgi:hypothetical protein
MHMRKVVNVIGLLTAGACGPGDSSAVRGFYPNVRVGAPLAEVIAAGEQAQAYDIQYSVMARECPGDQLYIERASDPPSIRVIHPRRREDTPWGELGGYHEVGYATRDEFVAALKETIPRFLACKSFQFTFGRYQGWPRSDSFTVTIDEQGRVATLSPLAEDQID